MILDRPSRRPLVLAVPVHRSSGWTPVWSWCPDPGGRAIHPGPWRRSPDCGPCSAGLSSPDHKM